MKLKFIQEEDFVNYKECSMFVGTAFCDFKCQKENPKCNCQNSILINSDTQEISISKLIDIFDNNIFSKAVVFGGLEPMLQYDDLLEFISKFRETHNNTVVIYTGYTEEELKPQINQLKNFKNIIIKFGRFIPEQKSHYDELLGVFLASNNQYAKRIGRVSTTQPIKGRGLDVH